MPLIRRPPGLPPTPRRPVPALLILAAMAVVLWWSLPAAWQALRLSGWHPETVVVVLGAHAMLLGGFGWIAWLFWAGRRPGDGG
jgi:hypothetical protein